MAKLIHIKFIKGFNIYSPGEYAFLCNIDKTPIGAIIRDKRYSDSMEIVRIQTVPEGTKYYKGFELKTIDSSTVASIMYKDINSQKTQKIMAKKEMTRENLLEEISKWHGENEKNRAAFVVLCERKDEEDPGNSVTTLLGHGKLIVASIGTIASNDPEVSGILTAAIIGNMNPLAALAGMLGKEDEEDNAE